MFKLTYVPLPFACGGASLAVCDIERRSRSLRTQYGRVLWHPERVSTAQQKMLREKLDFLRPYIVRRRGDSYLVSLKTVQKCFMLPCRSRLWISMFVLALFAGGQVWWPGRGGVGDWRKHRPGDGKLLWQPAGCWCDRRKPGWWTPLCGPRPQFCRPALSKPAASGHRRHVSELATTSQWQGLHWPAWAHRKHTQTRHPEPVCRGFIGRYASH